MRFLLSLFFLSFLINTLGAQTSSITTPEQNQKWLEELKILPVKEQVKKINERLLNDISELAKKDTQKLAFHSRDIHPLFVIDGVPVDLENDSKKIKELTTMLSQSENLSISILDKQAMVNESYYARGGIIAIRSQGKQMNKRQKK
jgi:hypothetical protein